MRVSVNVVAALAASAVFGAAATSALAECKRYGFEVNDYGKDGPTKDAKELLDKLIASKMAEKGVTDFHTGKKSVSCELFLNFIVFDEHTCAAEATVCWGGSPLPKSEEASAADDATPTKTSSDSEGDGASAKTSKKKKKEVAASKTEAQPTAEHHSIAESKSIERSIPDPKSVALKQAEKKIENNRDEKPAEEVKATDEASKEPTEPKAAAVDAATAEAQKATGTAASAAPKESSATAGKPVETGSLSDTSTKPAKHKAEKKAADGSAVVAPIKQKSDDAGYPTPVPPSADASKP